MQRRKASLRSAIACVSFTLLPATSTLPAHDALTRTMKITSILGSPFEVSRSATLLHHAAQMLREHASTFHVVSVRELPAPALLHAQFADAAIQDAIRKVHEAQVVLVATPIYKAAYSGLLKSFLDLLPQDGLRGKTVLPLATGGSAAHLLAIDYALKPVLSALGARDILDAVYATDAQIPRIDGPGYRVDDDVSQRIEKSLHSVIERAKELRAEEQAAQQRDDVLARLRNASPSAWPTPAVRWAV